MKEIGVVEGFFGPEWPEAARRDYAPFLQKAGGAFYIYAPKRDAHLRKAWREDWDSEFTDFLKFLVQHFQAHGIKFGVALSPFGIGTQVSQADRDLLSQKIALLSGLKVDVLGLFFDDMPVNEALSATQVEMLKLARSEFRGKIIFCPSFYTPDPILDKVFGQRPERYLEEVAAGISQTVSIAWTGPKVISEIIPSSHLIEVKKVLQRKPFLWENLYANDGPKNCHFLKIKPFTGRDHDFLDQVDGIGLNMMNQPYLSQALFLSSKLVMVDGMDPISALEKSLQELFPPVLSEIIMENQKAFLLEGDVKMTEDLKASLKQKLSQVSHPAAKEIINWLNGLYLVGPECLTD